MNRPQSGEISCLFGEPFKSGGNFACLRQLFSVGLKIQLLILYFLESCHVPFIASQERGKNLYLYLLLVRLWCSAN